MASAPPEEGQKASSGDGLLDGVEIHSEFTNHERQLVNKCIDAIERKSQTLHNRGLTKENFVLGVSNTLLVAWSFGAIPQHFWIIYLLEVCFLFPLRWVRMTRAEPKQHLYWLDFCWVSNMGAVFILLFLVIHHDVNIETRKRLFSLSWGLGNGPLLLATGLLGNALVFHDVDTTASVLIHLFPSLVLFVLSWEHDKVHEAWPDIFKVNYINDLRPWEDIYVNAAAGYMGWWVMYTLWLLTCGMNAPASGYDTIFHSMMRGSGGPVIGRLRGRPKEAQEEMTAKNEFLRTDALLYMVIHAISVLIGILASLVCFIHKWIHVGLVAAMTFMTIYNAASRYTYLMLQSYSQEVRKELGIPKNRRASAMSLP